MAKTIKGKLEFFSEMGISASVVRDYASKGGFDQVLSIKEGDELVVKEGSAIVFNSVVQVNYDLMKKHYSAVVIPMGVEYEVWMHWLRKNYDAELIKKS
jgi:hypothetical protein